MKKVLCVKKYFLSQSVSALWLLPCSLALPSWLETQLIRNLGYHSTLELRPVFWVWLDWILLGYLSVFYCDLTLTASSEPHSHSLTLPRCNWEEKWKKQKCSNLWVEIKTVWEVKKKPHEQAKLRTWMERNHWNFNAH